MVDPSPLRWYYLTSAPTASTANYSQSCTLHSDDSTYSKSQIRRHGVLLYFVVFVVVVVDGEGQEIVQVVHLGLRSE
jgi:hypothetical protein